MVIIIIQIQIITIKTIINKTIRITITIILLVIIIKTIQIVIVIQMYKMVIKNYNKIKYNKKYHHHK
jgi:hypothetical protein